MRLKSFRRAVALLCLVVIILSEWLWWESYKCTVNWAKRHELFPLPFYMLWLPHWLVVDLAMLMITTCSSVLAYLIISGDGS